MTSFFAGWGGGVTVNINRVLPIRISLFQNICIKARICGFEFPILLSIESAILINHARPAMTALNLLVYFYIDLWRVNLSMNIIPIGASYLKDFNLAFKSLNKKMHQYESKYILFFSFPKNVHILIYIIWWCTNREGLILVIGQRTSVIILLPMTDITTINKLICVSECVYYMYKIPRFFNTKKKSMLYTLKKYTI